MTPLRYNFFLLLLCLLAGVRQTHAQCTASAVATPISCFGQLDGSIDLSASGGTGPYVYLWSNGQTTEDVSGLVAGTYTCTVTDVLSCTATASADVTEPAALTVNITGSNVITCNQTAITLTANVSGGTAPYTYVWSNGQTTQFSTFTLPGTYSLTVVDNHGCTVASTPITVVQDANIPIACIAPSQILTCVFATVPLDASCSSQGPTLSIFWTGPGIIGGSNTLSPVVDQAGTYTLTVVDITNGCTSTASVVVTEDIVMPTVDAGIDQFLPCGGGTVTLQGMALNGGGFTYLWTTINGNIVSGGTTANPVVDESGTYDFMITNNANGCTATDQVLVVSSGSGLCSSIQGRVLQDTLANCLGDAGEPPLGGWIIQASGAQEDYYAVTDANGNYEVFVASGDTYSLTAIPQSALWIPCPPIPDIPVPANNQLLTAADLMFQKLVGCPMLSVDVSSGNLRRCFSNNQFSVTYCNQGTEIAEDAYVELTLDPFLSIVTASLPFTILSPNILKFEVGDLDIGECGSFSFSALLSCDAVLGQTHCTEAHIYPDTTCIPANPFWSGASLELSSECSSDSLRFRIENVGTGDMPNPTLYIVIEDQVMLMSAPVQLDAGEYTTVSVPANGSTWRLEVQQEPFHPGFSRPSLSVEGCTPGTFFSTGFVTQFSPDDQDAFVDIDCRESTGSYDPNDKQGFPKGYGDQHYIRPGTPLEYMIRFQNTGNDTAFTVRILDTLSSWLDPASFRAGPGSHPYSVDLNGAGVLNFLFENILLPDSNINEPASHGFVRFSIRPRADAPLETLIENTGAIYFDFNDPIFTNTTTHRLGENFVTVGLWQAEQAQYQILVSPNPFTDAAVLEIKGLQDLAPVHLQLFDLQGKMQFEMRSESTRFQINKGHLPAGIYLFNLDQEGQTIGAGKLIIR